MKIVLILFSSQPCGKSTILLSLWKIFVKTSCNVIIFTNFPVTQAIFYYFLRFCTKNPVKPSNFFTTIRFHEIFFNSGRVNSYFPHFPSQIAWIIFVMCTYVGTYYICKSEDAYCEFIKYVLEWRFIDQFLSRVLSTLMRIRVRHKIAKGLYVQEIPGT